VIEVHPSKGPIVEACYAIAESDGRKRTASIKRKLTNTRYTIKDDDRGDWSFTESPNRDANESIGHDEC
jgi:hypothetical protein